MKNKIKTAINTIAVIILPTLCFGITEYEPEDKLFIWAESGLKLRETPDFKSKVLTNIPFGKEVICKGYKSLYDYSNNSLEVEDNIETPDGELVSFKLKGNWVQIKFENIEGYVFDAYLSKFSPPTNKDENGLFAYFKARSDTLIYLEKKNPDLDHGNDKIVFSNGIHMTNEYHPNGASFQMNIPDFSIEEAFLMIRLWDKYAYDIKQQKNGTIFIDQELGGYTIESLKNVVIISGGWSC